MRLHIAHNAAIGLDAAQVGEVAHSAVLLVDHLLGVRCHVGELDLKFGECQPQETAESSLKGWTLEGGKKGSRVRILFFFARCKTMLINVAAVIEMSNNQGGS